MRSKRLCVVRKRVRILKSFKRSGARILKVARMGLLPSAKFGATCTGITTADIITLRRFVAEAVPGASGSRSTSLTLALAGADPGPALRW